MILLGKSFEGLANWRVDEDSFVIANGRSSQQTSKKTPRSFDIKTGSGASDHWPLYVALERKPKS